MLVLLKFVPSDMRYSDTMSSERESRQLELFLKLTSDETHCDGAKVAFALVRDIQRDAACA